MKYESKPLRCKRKRGYDRNLTNCFIRDDLITPELTRSINQICDKIGNINAGRFDIRFDNIEDFKKGINFCVLELNGSSGMDLKINVYQSYDDYLSYIFCIVRWTLVRISIGLLNFASGNRKTVDELFYISLKSIKHAYLCNDIGYLISPSTL